MTTQRSSTRRSFAMGKSLLSDTRGAGLVEYIILVGLIALAAIQGFAYFGTSVNEKAKDLGNRVKTDIK